MGLKLQFKAVISSTKQKICHRRSESKPSSLPLGRAPCWQLVWGRGDSRWWGKEGEVVKYSVWMVGTEKWKHPFFFPRSVLVLLYGLRQVCCLLVHLSTQTLKEYTVQWPWSYFTAVATCFLTTRGGKVTALFLQAPLEPRFMPILQKESPSLRHLLSEPMPSSGAAQNKTGSSGLRCIKKRPHSQKQPQIWQSVRPPPKPGVTRYLLPLRKSRLFLWLLLPFSQMHEPLVLMRSCCIIEKKNYMLLYTAAFVELVNIWLSMIKTFST